MKSRFLELIDMIGRIETLFHDSPNSPMLLGSQLRVINDVQEFKNWLAEVTLEIHDIVDRTGDSFARDTLDYIKTSRFNGWHDETYFENIKGKLMAMKQNIDKYYTKESSTSNLPAKIFVSHSSNDIKYVDKIVKLLDSMGLNQKNLFCSSVPGYGIPIGADIYDYLRDQFQEYRLHVIIIHSINYYNSPMCLNEMGAAWVLKNRCTSFLLPGFDFSSMNGCVNDNAIAIKLDTQETELKDKLNQLYEMIVDEFSMDKLSQILWEQKRDYFIDSIKMLSSES